MRCLPDILVAENVEGLVSSSGGKNYITLHNELIRRGYNVGAIILDAEKWVPQSRHRVFVIAVKPNVNIPQELIDTKPNWLHNASIKNVALQLDNWIWWHMPRPGKREIRLSDVVDWNAAFDSEEKTRALLGLVPQRHKIILDRRTDIVATGYRRMRYGEQKLELRFDGVAGCLRTPKGGSSRQVLVIKENDNIRSRLITPREAARLMGAPEDYWLPEKYNDAYMAMGDAVVVPVVNYLAKNLLYPISMSIKQEQKEERIKDAIAI